MRILCLADIHGRRSVFDNLMKLGTEAAPPRVVTRKPSAEEQTRMPYIQQYQPGPDSSHYDAVFIAGDILEKNEESKMEWIAEVQRHLSCPIYLTPGNHTIFGMFRLGNPTLIYSFSLTKASNWKTE